MGCESALFFHLPKGFQGCLPVLNVKRGWIYILLFQIFMIAGLLSLGFFYNLLLGEVPIGSNVYVLNATV